MQQNKRRKQIIDMLNIPAMIAEYQQHSLLKRVNPNKTTIFNSRNPPSFSTKSINKSNDIIPPYPTTAVPLRKNRTQGLIKRLKQSTIKQNKQISHSQHLFRPQFSSLQHSNSVRKGRYALSTTTHQHQNQAQHKQIENIFRSLYAKQLPATNKLPTHTIQNNSIQSTYKKSQQQEKTPRKKQKKSKLVVIRDRYQVVRKIGSGLSGAVYLANDMLSKREIAIKITAEDNEYKMLKDLRHPNIIQCYACFPYRGKVIMVLEYHKSSILELTPLALRQLSSAVMYLHSLNIAHRDIKQENILIDDQQNIKLIDFGLSMPCDALTHHTFCGSLLYMAPELLNNSNADYRKADVWALGILLYKLSFRRYPFRGKDPQQVLARISKKIIYPQQCSPLLKDLIGSMLCSQKERITMADVYNHPWVQ